MIINSSHHFDPVKITGFLVLDGVNGAGKTTLQKKLAAYLESKGFNVICTREPGGNTKLAQQIRPILLSSEEKMSSLAEAFLFAADRAEHVQKLILPSLAQKKIVLCDRYYYSSIAFQGYGREQDVKTIEAINHIAIQKTYPDFVLLLDLDPQEGLARAGKRNATGISEKDSMEAEELDFHKRLHDGFLHIAENYPEPFYILDAKLSEEKVFENALEIVGLWAKELR